MENTELINDNLLFKLLNRDKLVTDLLQIIRDLKSDIKNDTEVKRLNQNIGELTSYIHELEHFKSNMSKVGTKEEWSKLKNDNGNLLYHNNQLVTNNDRLKQEILKSKFDTILTNR